MAQGLKLFGAVILVEEKPANDDEKPKDDGMKEGLPCPRCDSMETKFCYYNNYDINQPRQYCRACQRYWTAGGAIREVPVGAGLQRARPPAALGYSDPYLAAWHLVLLQNPPAKRRCNGSRGGFYC